jgi:LemA protein
MTFVSILWFAALVVAATSKNIIALIVFTVGGLIAESTLIYNEIIKRAYNVSEAFATLDTTLVKRYDLIPRLIESVKGYIENESEVFEKIAVLRNKAFSDRLPEAKMDSDRQLRLASDELILEAKNNTELKTNPDFITLCDESTQIDGEVICAIEAYNKEIKLYNESVSRFPKSIVAKLFKLKPQAEYIS